MSVKKETSQIFLDPFLGAFFETTIMQNLDEIFSLTLKVLNFAKIVKILHYFSKFVLVPAVSSLYGPL